MAGLYAPSGGVNRLPKQWYAPTEGTTRKLKEIYGQDSGGVSRKIFLGNATVSGPITITWSTYDDWGGVTGVSASIDTNGLTISGSVTHNHHGTGSSTDTDYLYIIVPLAISSAQTFAVGAPCLKVNTSVSITAYDSLLELLPDPYAIYSNGSSNRFAQVASNAGALAAGTEMYVTTVYSGDKVNLIFYSKHSASQEDSRSHTIFFNIPNGALSLLAGNSGSTELPIKFV